MSTAVCVVMVGDGGQTSILWHVDEDVSVTPATVRAAADAFRQADAVLMTSEMPAESVTAAIGLGRDSGAGVFAQPAPVLRDLPDARGLPWRLVEEVMPNQAEARVLLAGGPDDWPADELLASALAAELGVRLAVVTLGADDCVLHGAEGTRRFPPGIAWPVDTTGASDAFTATFAAQLAAGASEADAVHAAQAAAVHAIERAGGYASMPPASAG